MKLFGTALALAFSMTLAGTASALSSDAAVEAAQMHLYSGKLADGERVLAAMVAADSDDAEARFALGGVQFVRAVERLAQDFYRHGLEPPEHVMIPLFRLPLPRNPSPEPLTYEALRTILATFVQNLEAAETTLAGMGDGDVKLPLHLGRVKLDLDGDGTLSEEETLWRIFGHLAGRRNLDAEEGEAFMIGLDRGDVDWLRGYSHVLMAFAEFLLAHDFSATFDHSFHLLFPRADLPYSGAVTGEKAVSRDIPAIADVIAFVHTIRWPVADASRRQAVRSHLKAVAAASRESWTAILAETDDDHEWVPNPNQTSLFPGLNVTEERVAIWLAAIDEMEAVLDGRKLLPHWRYEKGIDLKAFFETPQTFDLVLMLTGSGAVPFLADGEITSAETWDAIDSAFGGDFFSFAAWFN